MVSPPRSTHPLVHWHKLVLIGAGALLLASGGGWLVIHYSLGAGAGELPHPAEAWLMRLHGLAADAALFVLGAVAAAHVPQGWRLSRRHRWARQRPSGLAVCALAAAIVLTGYLLYYFAPESVRPTLGGLHAALGLLMAVALWVHGSHRRP